MESREYGLRKIGAVHPVHAHWSVSNATATIVMPTDTGKTDALCGLAVPSLRNLYFAYAPTCLRAR